MMKSLKDSMQNEKNIVARLKNLNKGSWEIQRQDIMTTQRLAIDHINTCHKVSSALQISSLTYHPFSLGQIQRVLGVHC